MERRYIAADAARPRLTRAEGVTAPRIEGYAAVYYDGSAASEYRLWEDFIERILPGAFDEAIAGDDVRGLFNHDSNQVLGRNKAGTMRLSVDKTGLFYSIDPPDTSASRDVQAMIGRGDVSGSSFAFDPVETGWTEITESGKPPIIVREIKKARLYDVGPVTYPAYEGTSTQLRSRGEVPGDVRAECERWMQSRRRPSLAAQLRARALEVE